MTWTKASDNCVSTDGSKTPTAAVLVPRETLKMQLTQEQIKALQDLGCRVEQHGDETRVFAKMESPVHVHVNKMCEVLQVNSLEFHNSWGTIPPGLGSLIGSPLPLYNYEERMRFEEQRRKIEEHLDSQESPVLNVSASKPRPLSMAKIRNMSAGQILRVIDEYSNIAAYSYDPAPFSYGSIRPKGDPIIRGDMHAGMWNSFDAPREDRDSQEPRELLRDEGSPGTGGEGA